MAYINIDDIADEFWNIKTINHLQHIIKLNNNNIHQKYGIYDETLLSLAARYDRMDFVKYLLDSGANIDPVDKDGLTPFITAICNGCHKIAMYLIDAGANIDCRDNTCRTGLFYAAQTGSLKMVKFLLDHGANKDYQDVDGMTACKIAFMARDFEIAEYIENYEPMPTKGVQLNG